MNDPGLDDPIHDGAKTVEQDNDDEPPLEEEEEQAFLNPRSVTQIELIFRSQCSKTIQPMVVCFHGVSFDSCKSECAP